MSEQFIAVSFGGGRNGAVLFALYEHKIKPDIITFANTGRLDHSHGEKPETYKAVERMSRWTEEHFGIPIIEVHKTGMDESLYDMQMRTKTLPSAAYGLRSCSDKWKIQPQEKFINNYEPAKSWWKSGRKITKVIGYDAGEQRRAAKIINDHKYIYWFPLIEYGWFLADCVRAYERHGLPVPPKSACYFCPSSTKDEVITLSERHPDLFESALVMERNAEGLRSVKGLGRRWAWSELIQISATERKILPEAPEMACVCFDSEG